MDKVEMVTIREEPIELCQLLKFAGFTGTGGEAKTVISEELVTVNGEVETRKRRKIRAGDCVTFGGRTITVSL